MIALARQSAYEGGNESRWPVVISRPPGHMTINEAIRRARNSEHYSGSREASALRGWVFRLARKSTNGPAAAVMYDDRLYIHPSMHPALSEPARQDRPAAGVSAVKALPGGRRNRGMAKLRAVQAFERFCRGPGRKLRKTDARAAFVKTNASVFTYSDRGKQKILKLSVRSLSRWKFQNDRMGIDALAKDGRGGRLTDGPAKDAAAMFWAMRNDSRRFSITHCWRMVTAESKLRGWVWFENLNTARAWDRKNRDERGLILNQRGDLKFAQRAGPYIEADPDSYDPGACWIGDDATCDVWVRTPGGKVIRPVISAWLDWRSRTIVGFKIARTGTENSLLRGFSDGAREYGLPASVNIDNGKYYSSYSWTGNRPKRRCHQRGREFTEQAEGIFALCEVQPSWALPYNPNAKARLERWFRELHGFCKCFPSYCGGTPDDRPEAHAKLVAKAVDWDEFIAGVSDFIRMYHNRPHMGEGMGGRTPAQVMSLAPRKRVIPEGVHDLILATWLRPVSIGRQGVSIKVAGTTLRYGARQPEILALNPGIKVRVGYDPDDLRSIVVWSMDYKFIVRTELNQRFNRAVPDEKLREVMRGDARHKKALRKVRKGGIDHFRNPIERTVAAMEQDAEKRRLPDPKPPGGGPLLKPVHTPIEMPSKRIEPLRKAVGYEDVPDMSERLHEYVTRQADATTVCQAEDGFDALAQWAERNESR